MACIALTWSFACGDVCVICVMICSAGDVLKEGETEGKQRPIDSQMKFR